MKRDDCIYLGSLIKTHGAKGEILLKSDYQLTEYENLESIFIEINNRLVPFFIAEIRQKSTDSFLINFDDINTDSKAREFLGSDVFILKSDLKQEAQRNSFKQINKVIGYQVIDNKFGILGNLESYHDIPSNPLLVVKSEEKEILIPFQEEFIIDVNDSEKIIYCKIPDAIINLND